MIKDIVSPLEKPKEAAYNIEFKNDRSREWCLHTIKHASSPDRIPKIQQFKDYYFPYVTEGEKIKYQKVGSS